MQYVYKITLLENYIYIGTTNNLKRRIEQHNENARKEKSYFGKFLKKNNIVIKLDDMQIIGKFSDRKEAFICESQNIKKYDNNKQYKILNIEKTLLGSRKGMNIGNTAKNFILIDIKTKTYQNIYDVKQFEEKNNITRGCLHRTYNKNSLCKGKYKLIPKDEWNDMPKTEKEYYISGKFILDRDNNIRKNKIKNYSKKYKLLEKNTNKQIIVENLDEFAKNHDMSSGTLHSTYTTGHFCKGYKVIERL